MKYLSNESRFVEDMIKWHNIPIKSVSAAIKAEQKYGYVNIKSKWLDWLFWCMNGIDRFPDASWLSEKKAKFAEIHLPFSYMHNSAYAKYPRFDAKHSDVVAHIPNMSYQLHMALLKKLPIPESKSYFDSNEKIPNFFRDSDLFYEKLLHTNVVDSIEKVYKSAISEIFESHPVWTKHFMGWDDDMKAICFSGSQLTIRGVQRFVNSISPQTIPKMAYRSYYVKYTPVGIAFTSPYNKILIPMQGKSIEDFYSKESKLFS